MTCARLASSFVPLRADARRNRAKVLEAAEEVFASEGLAVPIDEVARRAGRRCRDCLPSLPHQSRLSSRPSSWPGSRRWSNEARNCVLRMTPGRHVHFHR